MTSYVGRGQSAKRLAKSAQFGGWLLASPRPLQQHATEIPATSDAFPEPLFTFRGVVSPCHQSISPSVHLIDSLGKRWHGKEI